MVATVGSISIDLSTNVAKFAAGFRAGATTVERESARMGKAASGAEGRLLALGRAATGFLGGGLVARQIAQYADSWTAAGNQIRAAGELAGMQGRSLEGLNDIAKETRSGFSETVNLYGRLLVAGKGVAKNEEEIARATEIVNKAFKAGGKSASEQAAGILQLGQALESGVLQGDELRSLRENAGPLAQAIADEFGTTIGGLKALGEAGLLVSDRVFQGILNGQEKIEAAFNQTEITIADAVTQLGNAATEAVGKIDQATGASAALNVEILRLAGAIEQFADSPDLDKFLALFNIKIIEGGLTDQVRDYINEMGEAAAATEADAEKIRADIQAIEQQIFDLIQLGGEFDLMNAEKLAAEVAIMKDELASLETTLASTAANGAAAFDQLAESASAAAEAARKASELPTVTRYGAPQLSKKEQKREEKFEEKLRELRSDIRFERDQLGRSEIEQAVAAALRGSGLGMGSVEAEMIRANEYAEAQNKFLQDLIKGVEAGTVSVNELFKRGIQFDYASIADAVRTGIVSGLAQEREQYSISTTNPIQKQIDELQEMLEVAGAVAARGIREQIEELKLQLYLSKQGRELGGIGGVGGRNIAYAGRFAEGGSFVVPGPSSGDQNRVVLDANGGERVTVSRDGEGAKPTVVIHQTYQPAPGETERTTRQNMRNMTIEAYREVSRL
jgi:tape measure domain-containing protein